MKRQWLLIVFDGRGHDGRLHRLGLRPSRTKLHQYVGFYALGARPLLDSHIAQLRALGLHGVAKKIAQRERPGHRGSQRRPNPHFAAAARHMPSVVSLDIARENRLAADALKLAKERRRQAEILAEREVNRRVKLAIDRVNGRE